MSPLQIFLFLCFLSILLFSPVIDKKIYDKQGTDVMTVAIVFEVFLVLILGIVYVLRDKKIYEEEEKLIKV